MCNLVVSNIIDIEKIRNANKYGKRRGPDNENIVIEKNILFLHNLLSITGDNILQPLINDNGNIIILFNGEIYNYDKLFKNKTELECIYNLYENGLEQLKLLDGEFAIVIADFNINKIYLIHDVFGIKPIFIGKNDKNFCISSYASVSRELGLLNIEKIPPNCCIEFDLTTLETTILFELYKWDLNQYKNTFTDFNIALENSIKKRTRTDKEILVNMSSGYDTGTICCVLNKLGVKYNTISIKGVEDVNILNQRNKINKNNISKFQETITFDYREKDYYKNILVNNCENFTYNVWNRHSGIFDIVLDVHNDAASLGLSKIYTRLQNENIKIVLSGSGADEIMSDYSLNGNWLSNQTCFGGVFPNDLSIIFPKNCVDKNCIWKNFYYSVQELYISKEESLTGGFGMEGRFPFLDKDLVQEFLWLNPDLKNLKYKAPLTNYMNINQYPYKEEKLGFNPYS